MRMKDSRLILCSIDLNLDEIERDLKSEVKFKNVDQVANWIRKGEF